MRKLNKRKIKYVVLLLGMFGLGMLFQYFLLNSKAASELEQLNNEIKIAKENNKQLEREIINLHQEIENHNKTESTDTDGNDSNVSSTNQIHTTDSPTTVEEQGNASDLTNKAEKQASKDLSSNDEKGEKQDTSNEQSNQEKAINLVKEYIGYSNESNVHFEVQGNVSGTEDLSIQVYEVVVDEGESQHIASWGWYGVNLKTGEVYDING